MIELVLIILVAILIGLSLGLLGSGGSILTVPALTYILAKMKNRYCNLTGHCRPNCVFWGIKIPTK